MSDRRQQTLRNSVLAQSSIKHSGPRLHKSPSTHMSMSTQTKRTATSPLPGDCDEENKKRIMSTNLRVDLSELGVLVQDSDQNNEIAPLLNITRPKDGESDALDNDSNATGAQDGDTSIGSQLPPPPPAKAPMTLDEKVDILSTKVDQILGHLAASKNENLVRDRLIESKFKKIESAHNSLTDAVIQVEGDLNTCKTRVAHNAINIESNENSISALDTQIRICKASSEEYRLRLREVDIRMKNMQAQIDGVDRTVLDLGLETRERRIMLSGVFEKYPEDILAVSLKTLNEILAFPLKKFVVDPKDSRQRFRKLTLADIDNAFRTGRPNKNRNKKNPRSIVVTLSFTHIRQMILDAKPYLKGQEYKVHISEDLNADARNFRANLKTLAAGAKSLGLETKITGNKLIVGSEHFARDELNAIDPDIQSAAKQERIVSDGIAFKGDRSIYSNFFPASFTLEETEFANVEQYFQYKKATICEFPDQARKIMTKSNPWYAKAAGGRCEMNENWKRNRMRILYRGIYAKFDQNIPLKQALLNSAGLNLYEATTDLYYACGIGLDSPAWDEGKWPGENVTGKILMKVRDEFMDEDTFGCRKDNTLLHLTASQEENELLSASMNTTGESVMDTSTASMLDTTVVKSGDCVNQEPVTGANQEEWPAVSDSPKEMKKYNEVVKSPGKNPNELPSPQVKALPVLNKGHPEFTSNRGKGRRKKGNALQKSYNRPFGAKNTQISAEEREFLGKSTKQSAPSTSLNKKGSDHKNRKSPKNVTSTPGKQAPGMNMLNLSPTEREAMAYLGLEPDSEFVKTIISSRLARTK